MNNVGGDGGGDGDDLDGDGGIGGIEIQLGSVRNTTIAGNIGGGGAKTIYSTMGTGGTGGIVPFHTDIEHITVADNTGGMAGDGNLSVPPQGPGGLGGSFDYRAFATISASVLSGNHGDGPDCALSGNVTSGGFNVLGQLGDCDYSRSPSDRLDVDPGLQPLSDNGGPTQTMSIGQASVAADLIPRSQCSLDVDQRGQPRPIAQGCDAGAYEAPIPQPDAWVGLTRPISAGMRSPPAGFVGDDIWGDDGADQTVGADLRRGHRAVFRIRAQNDGLLDTMRVRVSCRLGQGVSARFISDGTDVSDLMIPGVPVGPLELGESRPLSLVLRASRAAVVRKHVSCLVTAASEIDASRIDAVRATAVVRKA